MKRVKAVNGYTIYEAAARDAVKYGYEAGCFYVFFSSDIRDYGIANSYPEFEGIGSLEAAEECCAGNYAKAREIVESWTTAASYEEIAEVEQLFDSGLIDEDGELLDGSQTDEAEDPLDDFVSAFAAEHGLEESQISVVAFKGSARDPDGGQLSTSKGRRAEIDREASRRVAINWEAVPARVTDGLAQTLLDSIHKKKDVRARAFSDDPAPPLSAAGRPAGSREGVPAWN